MRSRLINYFGEIRLYVIISVILWAFAGTLLGMMARSNIFAILSISFLASSVFNLIMVRSREKYRTAAFRPSFKAVMYGLSGYLIYNLCFGLAIIAYGNATEPTILNYTWPFFTVLFTVLFYKRQKAGLSFYVSTMLGFGGVILLASKGDLTSIELDRSAFGLIAGVGTGLSYGLFSAFSSSVAQAAQPKFLLLATLLSFIGMLAFAFYFHGITAFDMPASDFILALIYGLLLDSLGHVFWTRVQALTAERKEDLNAAVSLVYYLPLLSLSLIAIFLKEDQLFQPFMLGALLLITGSSVFPAYYRRYLLKKRKTTAAQSESSSSS